MRSAYSEPDTGLGNQKKWPAETFLQHLVHVIREGGSQSVRNSYRIDSVTGLGRGGLPRKGAMRADMGHLIQSKNSGTVVPS